jgi:hypothetical protein
MDTGYEERYMLLRANFTKLVGVNVCEACVRRATVKGARKPSPPSARLLAGGVAF